jgi:hypothetical protein
MPTAVSSLDNIETTGHFRIADSYQSHNTSFCSAEWASVLKTYRLMDSAAGSSHAENLENCRKFSWFVRHSETGKVRVSSNNCRLRWCPLCANAKKVFISRNLKSWLLRANYPKLLTVTLLHSNAPLAHQVNHLYQSFRKLRKSKLLRRTVTGGIWFFQIKFNPQSNQWHPHIHALITGKYIPHGSLSRLWLSITHTSKIIDIRSVTDFDKATFEVSRYCARPSCVKDIPENHRSELFSAMHGRRLCGSWGSGRSVPLSRPLDSDDGNWVRLGRWSTIRDNISFSYEAQQIYKCWLSNTPLPSDISLMELEDFIDNAPPEIAPEPPPVYLFRGF